MNLSEKEILNEIEVMLAPVYPNTNISMETYLEQGGKMCLDMSSLEIVEFIAALEEKYDIIIDLEDRYYTIGDVVWSIESYLRQKDGEVLANVYESEV